MKLKFTIDKNADLEMARSFGLSDDTIENAIDVYKTSLEYLKKTVSLYQSSWDEIGDSFSKYIEHETENAWFYPEYECIVSVPLTGISNWGRAPRIMRGWKENPYWMRRITAHELILSHYFEIYRHKYSEMNMKDGQIWALAEIAAFALTSLPSKVKEFWPWRTDYYTNHNYPHIVEIQNRLKDIFLKRKSFEEYMLKGFELVKEYPGMNPDGITTQQAT